MKLGTLNNGTRDGQLVVVSTDLTRFVEATHIAPNLRTAMDDWETSAPLLMEMSKSLNQNEGLGDRFRERNAMAPLPRAAQWADGSAYVNHVELVRKARGAEMPDTFWTDPLMYMGAPDAMIGPRDPIICGSEDWGIDMEAEVAVFVDDVPMGVTPEEAGKHIKMIAIINDVSLRNLIPAELGKGFGFFQSKGVTSFSPVAVTPDELGEAWDGGKVNLPMLVDYNNEHFGRAEAGVDMTFDFGKLISHAAKTRKISAGSIIGSGTISNKLDGGPGKPISEGGAGYSCIAEIRMIETINAGKPSTAFMKFGDTVRIDMKDASGHTIFGAIEQSVEKG